MNSLFLHIKALGFTGLALFAAPGPSALQAQTEREMTFKRVVNASEVILINLNGFTGETLSTLKFDLEAVGFAVKPAEVAQYLVKGGNSGPVEGRLIHAATQQQILARAYSGGSLRTQAHALADDIIAALRGCKGIAQTRVAFKVSAGGSNEIYVSDYDGHNATAVTSDHSLVAAPSWTPGGRMLYYTCYKLGNPDIYSHDLRTGERKVVARYTGLNTSAVISPDGRRLAMILSKAGSPDLYVADAGGANLRQLTQTKEDESSPCWSPDSQTICFTSRMNHRAELYTIPAVGGAMKRLRTAGVLNTTEPDWSPDGEKIAFTANMGGFQICVLDLKGGNVSVLTAGEDPSWSPNSRTLIFTRRTSGKNVLSLLDAPTKQVKDIAQISANGSQPSWAR